jgi:CRP-like cAMP-binding protein
MDSRYAELLTTFPMLDGYTVHGLSVLFERGRVRELSTDDILFREGEVATFVVLVLTGKVDLFVERDGRELSLHEAGPSRLLGELAVLAGVERLMSARAAGPTVVIEWNANAFRRLLSSDAQLSERIFRETYRSLVEEKQSLIGALSAVRDRQDQ